MRARTFIDQRVARNPLLRLVAYVLSGISASQLQSDVDILCNKVRLKRPLVQVSTQTYTHTAQHSHYLTHTLFLPPFVPPSHDSGTTAPTCE